MEGVILEMNTNEVSSYKIESGVPEKWSFNPLNNILLLHAAEVNKNPKLSFVVLKKKKGYINVGRTTHLNVFLLFKHEENKNKNKNLI